VHGLCRALILIVPHRDALPSEAPPPHALPPAFPPSLLAHADQHRVGAVLRVVVAYNDDRDTLWRLAAIVVNVVVREHTLRSRVRLGGGKRAHRHLAGSQSMQTAV